MRPNFFLISISLYFSLVRAQTCPACPKNGLWSEWTENAPCATTCGSCSTTTKTRTCLSDTSMGCPCVGNTTVTSMCGTQACNLPRTSVNQNLPNCCVGSPQIINNWYHCAPIEPELSLECCPTGGYWSTWSDYEKVDAKVAWTRKRSCLSGGHKCPCTGESVETVYSCPCTPIELITVADNPCEGVGVFKNFAPFVERPLVQTPSQCQMTFVVEATNYRYPFNLDTFTEDLSTTKYASLVGVVDANTNKCQAQYFHLSANSEPAPTGALAKRVYDCDLKTLRYYGHSQTNIVKIAQFYQV